MESTTTATNSLNSTAADLIETEANDTIDTATPVVLTTETPQAIATGAINFDFENNRDVDATEDVDLYTFDLAAGDTIRLDVDAAGETLPLEFAELILFDSEGNNLAQASFADPGPDDAFVSFLPCLEYTATEARTYFAGVSAYFNVAYDPFTAGSGSGLSLDEFDLNSLGDYTLEFELVNDSTPEPPPPTQPPSGETPPADAPTVSLQTIVGTYGLEGEVVAPAVVETVSDLGFDPLNGLGGAAINVLLTTEGAIPAGGVEVTLNTDANLAEYLFIYEPFIRGAEILGPVLDAAGNPSGIRLNLTQNTALLNLLLTDKPEPETDGSEQLTFTLDSSDGNISPAAATSTVTVYDTVADVPIAATDLTVGLTVENSAITEAAGDTTTFTFTLSEPPPPEGLLVYINATAPAGIGDDFGGSVFGLLGQFNVFGIEVTGGAFPIPNFSSSGFYFQITEQTATITTAAFPDEVVEGVQAFQVTLGESRDYQVDPAASAVTVTIGDTAESLPQLSLSTAPAVLVESEGTVSVDRKSTRLNSSHRCISYAVFCLKKKN